MSPYEPVSTFKYLLLVTNCSSRLHQYRLSTAAYGKYIYLRVYGVSLLAWFLGQYGFQLAALCFSVSMNGQYMGYCRITCRYLSFDSVRWGTPSQEVHSCLVAISPTVSLTHRPTHSNQDS